MGSSSSGKAGSLERHGLCPHAIGCRKVTVPKPLKEPFSEYSALI